MIKLFFENSEKKDPAANVDIYFDPNVNYLVRKVAYSYPTHNWEGEIPEFKEHGPGLFFPTESVGTSQMLPSKDKLYDSKTKFSDVQINQPLPNNIFSFNYPHNVILGDDIRGCQYRIDANGNQISKETPFGREPPPPGDSGDEKQAFGTETQEEPQPLSRWILPISVGILISGGVAAFLRGRKRQAESA